MKEESAKSVFLGSYYCLSLLNTHTNKLNTEEFNKERKTAYKRYLKWSDPEVSLDLFAFDAEISKTQKMLE